VRTIAHYLPQFHPTPENDAWWGAGFTEWRSVALARPVYSGQRQPRLPGELGFYDLRLPEVREAQAELARGHGIDAFCYWDYWLGGGRRLLPGPSEWLLETGKPDFPFCLGWANHSWTGVWFGAPGRILAEQTYPGPEDDEAHFRSVLRFFRDRRYVTVGCRPVFLVHRPWELPEKARFVDRWQELARAAGLPGLFLVGQTGAKSTSDLETAGFDAALLTNPDVFFSDPTFVRGIRRRWRRDPGGFLLDLLTRHVSDSLNERLLARKPTLYDYREANELYFRLLGEIPRRERIRVQPCVFPDWDNTPRRRERGAYVFLDGTPELFGEYLRRALLHVRERESGDDGLVWIKSWNEWAEGNYLEPGLVEGRSYLEAAREAVRAVRLSG